MFRNTLSILLLIAFSLSFPNCSGDDDRRGQRRSPEEQANTLQEELDLTDDQAKQLEKVLLDGREEMKKARENFNGDRSEIREVIMEYREKIDEQIEEILNDEQKEKYQEIKEERLERMRERRRDR